MRRLNPAERNAMTIVRRLVPLLMLAALVLPFASASAKTNARPTVTVKFDTIPIELRAATTDEAIAKVKVSRKLDAISMVCVILEFSPDNMLDSGEAWLVEVDGNPLAGGLAGSTPFSTTLGEGKCSTYQPFLDEFRDGKATLRISNPSFRQNGSFILTNLIVGVLP